MDQDFRSVFRAITALNDAADLLEHVMRTPDYQAQATCQEEAEGTIERLRAASKALVCKVDNERFVPSESFKAFQAGDGWQ